MKLNYCPKNEIKDIFPEPGIYRLIRLIGSKALLVYVGQSVNLRKRLMAHKRTSYLEFNYFDYDYYPRKKLNAIENKELDEFQDIYGYLPRYNKQGGNKR